MPELEKGKITLENPDHTQSDFRQNNHGKINRAGTINYGNGVTGKIGLLRGSGNEDVYIYEFDEDKYDEESAKDWIEDHRSEKAMGESKLKNKKFKFNMPLIKADKGNDGYLYLEFALATTDVDLENEQLTDDCLKDMLSQALDINVYLDHQYDLPHTVGPVTDATINGSELWVKGRVRKELEATVQDILDSETKMGGSFGGVCVDDFIENGIRKLNRVNLLDATFTPMPVNTATSGTGKVSKMDCTVCNQIFKSIESKYGIEKADLEDNNVTRTEDESYEAIISKVRAAIRNKFTNTFDGLSEFWVKLTFPDSVIIESFKDDKLYEIAYNINEAGEVELGEPVEVQEQYVEKKLEVFKTKAIEHEPPADYENKSKIEGDESMDETKVQEMIDKSNDKLLGEIKGLLEPKEPAKEPKETKAIDEDAIADRVTKGVLKSLGLEEEQEAEPEEGKIIIMDSKALEDLQADTIQKTILGLASQRKGERKSKSIGGNKFEFPEEVTEEEPAKETKANGKMSTRKSAEAIVKKYGIAA